MVESELLFYTREQAPDEARRLHYLLIDASASMRGERRGLRARSRHRARQEAAARGRRGVDALLRLAPLRRAARAGRAQLPAGMAPRASRASAGGTRRASSRSWRRRSRSSARAISAIRSSTSSRTPRCTCRGSWSQEVRRHAHLFGVFILPSGGVLDLEWLDLLDGHAVVDHATLKGTGTRAAAAARIVATNESP